MSRDIINHPDHYKAGGIETIDYIKAKLTPEQFEGYLAGNVIKYISRYRHKNGVEDLRKCMVYLKWLIELKESDGGQSSKETYDPDRCAGCGKNAYENYDVAIGVVGEKGVFCLDCVRMYGGKKSAKD